MQPLVPSVKHTIGNWQNAAHLLECCSSISCTNGLQLLCSNPCCLRRAGCCCLLVEERGAIVLASTWTVLLCMAVLLMSAPIMLPQLA